MKTYIVTFKCALSNEIKAVEFENCAIEMTESDAKAAARAKYGKAIILVAVECIEQGIKYFNA